MEAERMLNVIKMKIVRISAAVQIVMQKINGLISMMRSSSGYNLD